MSQKRFILNQQDCSRQLFFRFRICSRRRKGFWCWRDPKIDFFGDQIEGDIRHIWYFRWAALLRPRRWGEIRRRRFNERSIYRFLGCGLFLRRRFRMKRYRLPSHGIAIGFQQVLRIPSGLDAHFIGIVADIIKRDYVTRVKTKVSFVQILQTQNCRPDALFQYFAKSFLFNRAGL